MFTLVGLLTMRVDGSYSLIGHDADFVSELIEEAQGEALREDPRVLGIAVVELYRGDVTLHAAYDPRAVRAIRLFVEALELLFREDSAADAA